MKRTKIGQKYKYNLQPTTYPISNNNPHSTYDQFIQLRDTLIFSGKYYSGKKGCKLIVGDREETIEIMWKNWFKLSFEPGYKDDPTNLITLQHEGPYVSRLTAEQEAQYQGMIGCIINEDGHYRMVHKEEILTTPTTKKVYCYFDYYAIQADGTYKEPIPIAVFDWQGEFSKQFSGSVSSGGSCSITVNFTLGNILQKITAFGYNERNMKKGDILMLRCVDQDKNELTYQQYSNFISVDFTDLTLKE